MANSSSSSAAGRRKSMISGRSRRCKRRRLNSRMNDLHQGTYQTQAPKSSASVSEPGEASKSSKTLTFTCEICVDTKPRTEFFAVKHCSHSYCSDCICNYITSKIEENITQIRCPVSDCEGILEPEHCRPILAPKVFDKWGDALCEALISESDKFYCPFKDCSALLIMDADNEGVLESECPFCHKLFCAQCKAPWHSGVECEEFQKLHEDEREREDILLMKLAEKNKWTRCSKCKFYVKKSEGCLFMTCRCGYDFCYNCGAPVDDHYCDNCKH